VFVEDATSVQASDHYFHLDNFKYKIWTNPNNSGIIKAMDLEDMNNYTYNNTNIDVLKNSISLIASAENPELVDSDILDAFLGNLRLQRFEGSKATGKLVIVLSDNVSTAVSKLTEFTAGDVIVVPTTSSRITLETVSRTWL